MNKINNSKIHSKLINFLDRIFIDVLKSNPSKAPKYFNLLESLLMVMIWLFLCPVFKNYSNIKNDIQLAN